MENIVSGQTTITKVGTEILSKDFLPEGKIWNASYIFSESSWQPREDIFSTKDVFKYKYLLICYFKKATRLICNNTRQII